MIIGGERMAIRPDSVALPEGPTRQRLAVVDLATGEAARADGRCRHRAAVAALV
ncbi:MAG: hypothetical protein KL785_05945 [Brevundimonas sp.]|nr:hypothetical protein [Brevundimonas sp.]